MEQGRADKGVKRVGAPGAGAGDAAGEGVAAHPAPGSSAAVPEVPPLTYADYAAFARQGDAQLLACCAVETFHASGPGGQGVNTADSAVRMRHVPTGIVVVARSERTQLLNRRACLAKLRAELERRSRPPKKRKKTHVPHRAKERRLQAKHQISAKKSLRGKVSAEE